MDEVPPRRASPWLYVAGGCLLVIVIAVVAAVTLWHVATRRITQAVDANIHDPAARERIAKRLLRADALPAGYYPVSGTFEIPLLVHVRLSDRKPDASGRVIGYDQHGFIYTEAPWTSGSEEVAKFFASADDSDAHIQHVGVYVTREETVGHGNVGNIRYSTIRGQVREGDTTYEGPITLMLIDCSAKKERTAIWFGPEVGDANAIRTMMAHFALCKPRS